VNLDDLPQSYYELLQISPSSSLSSEDIKAAYHRALLKFHPDKAGSAQEEHKSDIDIAQLKEAYITLSSSHLRAEYDFKLADERLNNGSGKGPRPAQIISLEDFDERLDGFWYHACRCGGDYIISETDMEKGCHLVGCNSCSEVVWVGYEIVEDLEADQNELQQ